MLKWNIIVVKFLGKALAKYEIWKIYIMTYLNGAEDVARIT